MLRCRRLLRALRFVTILAPRLIHGEITLLLRIDEEEIAPHLDKMMTRLLELLSTSSSRDVQEMAISTISAVAASADRKILPYAAVRYHYVPGMEVG